MPSASLDELKLKAREFAETHDWEYKGEATMDDGSRKPVYSASFDNNPVRDVFPLAMMDGIIVWQDVEKGADNQYAVHHVPIDQESMHTPALAPTHDSHHGGPSSFDPRLAGFMQEEHTRWSRQEGVNNAFATNIQEIQKHEDERYAYDKQLEEDAKKNMENFEEEKRLEKKHRELEKKEIQELRERVSEQELKTRQLAAQQQDEINKLMKQLEKTRPSREAQTTPQAASLPRREQSAQSSSSSSSRSSKSRSRSSRPGNRFSK